jgi:D-alanine-D-alanine ligase
VAAALDGCEVELVPVEADLSKLRARLLELRPDCAFNLCESIANDGRLESAVPLVLELMDVPFTGSPPEALGRAVEKHSLNLLLRKLGIPAPAGQLMHSAAQPCQLPFPLIVKPSREDGSIGISPRSLVHDARSLRAAVDEVISALHQPCLVEQYVEGREFAVSLLGWPEPEALPITEIDFSLLPPGAPRLVCYRAKWEPSSPEFRGTVPRLDAPLPAPLASRIRDVAAGAFRAAGLRDYGRIDIRLSADGVPWVIDVNPNCDLAPDAGFARAARAGGVEYAALVRRLVSLAMVRAEQAQPRMTETG